MTNPPLLSPEFSRVGGLLKIKPYPDAPVDIDTWDLSPEFAAIVTAQTTANTGVSNAATALAAANEADDTADAAQSTANTALANAATALAAANAAAAAAAAITPKGRRVTMFHDEANVSGGTLTLNISSLLIHNFVAFSTVQGFNAYHSFDCDLMPACKLFFIGSKNNGAGILTVYLDGNVVNTLDFYNSTSLVNQISSLSFAANVITAGRHVLRLEVATKNASSSGYSMSLTKYWLAPNTE